MVDVSRIIQSSETNNRKFPRKAKSSFFFSKNLNEKKYNKKDFFEHFCCRFSLIYLLILKEQDNLINTAARQMHKKIY